MRALIPGFLLFSALLQQKPASDSPPAYSQTYVIFLKGERSGTESVTMRTERNGDIVYASEHEIFVADGLETKRMAFLTELVLAKGSLSPIRYAYKYTSGESRDFCEVTVKGGQIHRVLGRGGRTSEASMPLGDGVLLFDFNVYHHYELLARKYDFKKGGRQMFRGYVPVVGGEIALALTRLEDSELEAGKESIGVRSFRIEFVGVSTGTFSIDKAGRLVRVALRDRDLEVVRKDLIPEPVTPPPGE